MKQEKERANGLSLEQVLKLVVETFMNKTTM